MTDRPSTPSSQRLKLFVARLAPLAMPLAYAVFTLLVYWRLWTPIDGARASWRFDPRFEYWGDLIFQYRTLSDGFVALWNPFDRGGFPLFGDPQPGLLYPPNWLFSLWGMITGDVPYAAISVKILGHWVFGAVGMHLFVRRLGAAEPACYVGGILFAFTAPKIRYGGSALNWSVAWIPWVLLAVDWYADKPSLRRGAVLGSAAAMVLLAGAPAVLMYMLIVAVPYGLFRLRGRLRANLRSLAFAGAVFAMWLAPLVASNLEQLPESVRTARSLSFITDSAFSAGSFLGFLVPRIGGENPYVSLLAILCAGLLLATWRGGRPLLFAVIAAVGVGLALGNHAGLLPAAASALPPFSLFRRAHRYLYVASIALAVLGALGLGHALTIDDRDRKQRLARAVAWVGGLSTFALGLSYLISVIVTDSLAAPKNDAFALATVSAAAGTFLLRAILLADGRRRVVYGWIAALAVALDIWTAGSPTVDVGMVPNPACERDSEVAELDDLRREWRVYDHGYLDYRAGTRLGIRDFSGYEGDPLSLSRYDAFRRAAVRDLPLLGHANVRYVLEGRKQPPLPRRSLQKLERVRKGVYELGAVAPAVMYVPAAKTVKGVKDGLSALRAMVPGQGAVVEGEAPPAGPRDASVSAGVVTVLEPNRVVAEVQTPGPGLVVIAEAYFSRWRATVDGEDTVIQPANVMFRGVPVRSAGHHVIEMRLRPVRFWGLLPVYLGAFGLLLWALSAPLWDRRRARRRRRSSTPPTSAPTRAEESA